MEKNYKYSCGNCKKEWLSSEAKDFADENSEFPEDRAEFEDYKEGYKCPVCRSSDISGEEIK